MSIVRVCRIARYGFGIFSYFPVSAVHECGRAANFSWEEWVAGCG